MDDGRWRAVGWPAHVQGAFELGGEYGLPGQRVVAGPEGESSEIGATAYTEDGTIINSDFLDGLDVEEAKRVVADAFEKIGRGDRETAYRLRDWGISRQRYWGTPIPMVYCDGCGVVPVPEKDLPVLLPNDADFTPTGESPLAANQEFLNTECPGCGADAKRETDTMDTFMDSSWYHLKFASPDVQSAFEKEKIDKWSPVDQYMGGAEHAVMHLLYARFFNKVLRDLGYLNFDEP